MGESNFVLKVEAACQKKEELYTASKARYAVRSMFAGVFLTMRQQLGLWVQTFSTPSCQVPVVSCSHLFLPGDWFIYYS